MNTIPLRPDLTRDEVDDVAYEGGWHLLNVLPATDRFPAQRIFLAPDRLHNLVIVDDARLGPPYAVVQGEAPGRWEEEIRARFGAPEGGP
jgi:hypothetical protein